LLALVVLVKLLSGCSTTQHGVCRADLYQSV
jgi:hypothetical protein